MKKTAGAIYAKQKMSKDSKSNYQVNEPNENRIEGLRLYPALFETIDAGVLISDGDEFTSKELSIVISLGRLSQDKQSAEGVIVKVLFSTDKSRINKIINIGTLKLDSSVNIVKNATDYIPNINEIAEDKSTYYFNDNNRSINEHYGYSNEKIKQSKPKNNNSDVITKLFFEAANALNELYDNVDMDNNTIESINESVMTLAKMIRK